jgi:hypothetical protein
MQNGGTSFCVIKKNIFDDEDEFDPTSVGFGFVWHDVGLNSSNTVEIDSASNRYRYNPVFIESFCNKYSPMGNVISGMVGGHEHYFAKNIAGAKKNELTPAVGYVKVAQTICGTEVKTDLIRTQYEDGVNEDGVSFFSGSGSSFRCFSIVKFISAPTEEIAYKPTYLIISRCIAMNMSYHVLWNYRVVECS